ncbi:MAG TPA: hypothetical protein P5232_02775 [Candidatus Moranbacteria bacterium]|nr:hypothetical protein [Candidatus Moranbacteria bacterium]
MRKEKILISLALTILGLTVLALNARAEGEIDTNSSSVDCFDYYKFQSVQVSLGTEKGEYNSGETVTFKGEITNKNDYPVVDGNVFVRISEKNPNYAKEGQFNIDELIAVKDISLDAKETKAVEFNWTAPENVKAGEYRADFFFSVGKKFNLGGLPFTNEIVAGLANFKINSDNNSSIFFDRSKTQVNGEKYRHIGNWPEIKAGQKAEIIQPINNTYEKDKEAVVIYDLYFWDSLDEKDKITSKTEEITIPAGESKNLSYAIDEMNDSVYFLKITAISENEKSIVNIRLSSKQIHSRLNYPAITKFPVKENDEFTLFSCFHNTADVVSPSNKITLSLYDKNDNLIDKLEYQGNITSAMMAGKKDITAKKNYDYIKLRAAMNNDKNEMVDEYETVYDCNKINKDKCFVSTISKMMEDQKTAKRVKIMLVTILLIIISVILIIFFRNKRMGIRSVIIFLLISSGMLIANPNKALGGYNGKTCSENNGESIAFELFGSDAKFNFDFNMTHNMEMTAGNYIVEINNPINFSYLPELLSYNASGGAWDTPYGEWTDKSSDEMSAILKKAIDDGSAGNKYFKFYSIDKEQLLKRYQSDLEKELNNLIEEPGTAKQKQEKRIETLRSQIEKLQKEIEEKTEDHYGYLNVFDKMPVAGSIESSDSSVISCNGLNCIAKKPGIAILTANFPTVTPKIVAGFWQMYEEGEKKSENDKAGFYKMDSMTASPISGCSVSWMIVVREPVAPFICLGEAPMLPKNKCLNTESGLTKDTPWTEVENSSQCSNIIGCQWYKGETPEGLPSCIKATCSPSQCGVDVQDMCVSTNGTLLPQSRCNDCSRSIPCPCSPGHPGFSDSSGDWREVAP